MTGAGSGDHGSLQLAVLGRMLAAGLGFGGVLSVESILGGFLGCFELEDLLDRHGSRFGVRLSSAVPKSYHHGLPCATTLVAVTLGQPCLINPLSPTTAIATLLR